MLSEVAHTADGGADRTSGEVPAASEADGFIFDPILLLGEVHTDVCSHLEQFQGNGGGGISYRGNFESDIGHSERMGVRVRPDVLAWAKEEIEAEPN
jgi:hypothetical protein